MKDDKLCISPDALIAMIVTEAQDRALAQMPGPEAPLGEVQASDAFLRRMDAVSYTHLAVSMIMGVLSLARILRQTSHPSITGIITSSRTRSGCSLSKSVKACLLYTSRCV